DFGRKAVSLEAGNAVIEGNTFCPGPVHVDIGPKAQGAVIMGNLAQERFTVRKPAAARNIQLLDNTPGPSAAGKGKPAEAKRLVK
ncbi:MAG: hypothetical protein ILO36_08580, partial [Abditibacteriota bacterium]|nr:hypothetical protein [Abditibacteriota bacterium]